MYINGKWLTGHPEFPITNPATGDVIGQVPDCTDQDIEAAIAAAHHALKNGKRRPPTIVPSCYTALGN